MRLQKSYKGSNVDNIWRVQQMGLLEIPYLIELFQELTCSLSREEWRVKQSQTQNNLFPGKNSWELLTIIKK